MNQKGQALIILLVAIALALSILTAAITSSIVQGKNTSRNILGRRVYYAAETGAEYALMKIMRTPGSCNGTDNLALGSANINICERYVWTQVCYYHFHRHFDQDS